MSLIATSPEDLPGIVSQVLDIAAGRRKWLLYGDLGAGKTAFVKAFCRHLGTTETASSPTFSLVNEYFYTENGVKQVIRHMDLYRLNNIDEALDIGIEDYLDDPDYTLIEWPEVIEPLLPPAILKIHIEITGDSARKFVIL
jgi:tRNA threonylcarbamoyladenosine biosynthesis protein TsaE